MHAASERPLRYKGEMEPKDVAFLKAHICAYSNEVPFPRYTKNTQVGLATFFFSLFSFPLFCGIFLYLFYIYFQGNNTRDSNFDLTIRILRFRDNVGATNKFHSIGKFAV